MIYLLATKDKKFLKIGYSENVESRIKIWKSSIPFELETISILDGNRVIENWLHARFRKSRVRREWFTYSSEIINDFKNVHILFSKEKNDFDNAVLQKCKRLSVSISNKTTWRLLFYILSEVDYSFQYNVRLLKGFNYYLKSNGLEPVSRSTMDRAIFDLVENNAINKIGINSTYAIQD